MKISVNKLLVISLCVFIASATLFAQAPVDLGILNGKAKALATPVYPAAAKATHAGGTVGVFLLVDETGNVLSATAIDGDQSLRAAAEDAAKRTTFIPQTAAGKPIKFTGRLVFNFVPAKDELKGFDQLLKAVEPQNSNVFALVNARTNIDAGKYDAAIAGLTESLKLLPDMPSSLGLRSAAYYKKGDSTSAKADADKAISLDLNQTDALLTRAQIYLDRSNVGSADLDLLRVINSKTALIERPASGYTYFDLLERAKAYALHGDDAKAAADYKRVLSTEKENDEARKGLAAVEAKMKTTSGGKPDPILRKRFEETVNAYVSARDEYDNAADELDSVRSEPATTHATLCSLLMAYTLAASDLDLNLSMLEDGRKDGSIAKVANANELATLDGIIKWRDGEFALDVAEADKEIKDKACETGPDAQKTVADIRYEQKLADVDYLLAQYDAKVIAIKKGDNACANFNQAGEILAKIQKVFDQIAKDNRAPYIKGRADYDKRKRERSVMPPPEGCILV